MKKQKETKRANASVGFLAAAIEGHGIDQALNLKVLVSPFFA